MEVTHSYIMKDGQVVFNNGWSWIVVFPAMNKRNFAVVKCYNGSYTIIEMYLFIFVYYIVDFYIFII